MKRQKVFSKILIDGLYARLYGRHGYAVTVRYDPSKGIEGVIDAADAKGVLAEHPVTIVGK